MSELVIYGASDDLIELAGVIRDELNPRYGKPDTVIIKVDDAVVVRVPVNYDDDGTWRIAKVASIGWPHLWAAARGEDEPDDEDGCPGYSEKLILHLGDVEARRLNVSMASDDV